MSESRVAVSIDGVVIPLAGRVALMVLGVLRESPKLRRYKAGRLELHFGRDDMVTTSLCEPGGPVSFDQIGHAALKETA